MRISGPVSAQIAAAVWSYSPRSLAGVEYFRKTHISVQWGSFSVPANSSAYYDIQPAAGEIWEVAIGACFFADTTGSFVELGLYDGSSIYIIAYTRGSTEISVFFSAALTNARWIRVIALNTNLTTARDCRWGYSGWKIGTS